MSHINTIFKPYHLTGEIFDYIVQSCKVMAFYGVTDTRKPKIQYKHEKEMKHSRTEEVYSLVLTDEKKMQNFLTFMKCL